MIGVAIWHKITYGSILNKEDSAKPKQSQVEIIVEVDEEMTEAFLQKIRREERENGRRVQELLGCGFDQCEEYCLLDFPHELVNEFEVNEKEILQKFWESAGDMDVWEDDGFYYRRRVMAVMKIMREKDAEIDRLRPAGDPVIEERKAFFKEQCSLCHIVDDRTLDRWSLLEEVESSSRGGLDALPEGEEAPPGHKYPPRIRKEVGTGPL
ncbi:MAG: hypothetical protein HOA57_00890 [Candidatus Magasanikbacteria bacterium]|nr:hypothetical protein [Candidatus Magasanikbacteria bacterium]MBT4547303.1 hypothetical protein [Candidatus Magasanikbacteria bacterium]MBT6818928.1 hypothetical protein [Candidatus Magasanikbacteria bacterium]